MEWGGGALEHLYEHDARVAVGAVVELRVEDAHDAVGLRHGRHLLRQDRAPDSHEAGQARGASEGWARGQARQRSPSGEACSATQRQPWRLNGSQPRVLACKEPLATRS